MLISQRMRASTKSHGKTFIVLDICWTQLREDEQRDEVECQRWMLWDDKYEMNHWREREDMSNQLERQWSQIHQRQQRVLEDNGKILVDDR